MRFWVREIAGWLLVALGLFVFYLCFVLLDMNRVVETGPMALIGIIIFRGGIHLLKVAVAARICFQTQTDIKQQREGNRILIRTR
jgi:hypothetical protein